MTKKAAAAKAKKGAVKRRTSRTPRARAQDRQRAIFLETFRTTCNVSEAARSAGVGRRTVYDWRDADEEFAAAWLDAENEAVDALEAEARRRAMTDSDKLMEILLKAHRPEKYVQDAKVKATLDVTGGIEVRHTADEMRNMLSDRLAGVLPQVIEGKFKEKE